MTGIPIYRLHQVHHWVSPEFSLNIEDWQHPAHETLCLAGPTGAGKTTFLKLLTGLVQIRSGSMAFDGRAWRGGLGMPGDVQQITLVPQRPLLLARSVRANLEYGLRLRGIHDTKRVDEILERLGLMSLAAKPAQTLSGGQTQLVALGRALVLKPRVLLLDEPTANLDPSYVALVEEVLIEWRTRYQTTLIWATHQMHQAQRVADRMVLLLDGQITETALRDDFFERPSDQRTRDFVDGKMVY